MKATLNLLALLAVSATAACAADRYEQFDDTELADAYGSEPVEAEGTFSRVGEEEWVFQPYDPEVADATLGVPEEAEVVREGQAISPTLVEEGEPVRVRWDAERGEVLRIEVLQEPTPGAGGEAPLREAAPGRGRLDRSAPDRAEP